jgi:hypothetical protein
VVIVCAYGAGYGIHHGKVMRLFGQKRQVFAQPHTGR